MGERIFAIESSCDESAMALFDSTTGVVGEWVHSQIALHQEYGGVVPDLASREHLERFGPMLEHVSASVELANIDKIAVTCGPGLAGCLAIGISFAKALALAWEVPLVGINHLRGHAFSPFINLHKEAPEVFATRLQGYLPHLGLLVSGGNTLLFCIEKDLSIEILAKTVDDAAGEALDKGAKLLGMDYPGGPLIEKQAEGGDVKRFDFPRSGAQREDMRFSFSGLKTSLRYRLEKMDDTELAVNLNDLCASYQEAVVGQLIRKVRHVRELRDYASLGLSGGVANNQRLRAAFETLAHQQKSPLFIAERQHTGDNGAMIAFAAWLDAKGAIPASEGLQLEFSPALGLA